MAGEELGTLRGKIQIDYDDRGIGTATGDVDRFADRSVRGSDRGRAAFGQMNRTATVGAAAVVVGFGLWARSAITAAEESEAATAVLEQVFESMGGTAHEAFLTAADSAVELGERIAVDNDEVTAIQTKLATFGNVWRDPVHGAENFGRATELAFDLASAGFGDASGNATMLGRALGNPTRGLSALTRAGVEFTDQERAKIIELQASGDLLGAQEIMFEALENQVGGAAEAGVTSSQRMRVGLEELSETFGAMLLPAVDAVASRIDDLTQFVEDNQRAIAIAAGVLVSMAAGFLAVNAAISVFRTIATIATAVQWALNVAMLANPVGLVVAAIVILIGIIAVLMIKFKSVRDAVMSAAQEVWGQLKAAIDDVSATIQAHQVELQKMADFIANVVVPIVQFLFVNAIRQMVFIIKAVIAQIVFWIGVWDFLWQKISTVVNFISGAISGGTEKWKATFSNSLNFIKNLWSTVWNAVKNFFVGVWNAIHNHFSTGIARARAVFSAGLNAIRTTWNTVFNAIRTVVSTVINAIKTLVQGGVDRVKAVIGGLSSIISTVRNAFNNAKNAAQERISALVELVRGLPDRAKSALGNLASKLYSAGRDLILGLINGIRDMAGNAASAAIDAVSGAVDAAKSFLNIGSPSRLTEHVIGLPMMQGVAKGVARNEKLPENALRDAFKSLPRMVPPMVNAVVSGESGGSRTYTFGPGSITLDLSKMKSIDDVVRAIEGLRTTSRQFARKQ
jgi:phage-related protein